jgi:hypothetical protein
MPNTALVAQESHYQTGESGNCHQHAEYCEHVQKIKWERFKSDDG